MCVLFSKWKLNSERKSKLLFFCHSGFFERFMLLCWDSLMFFFHRRFITTFFSFSSNHKMYELSHTVRTKTWLRYNHYLLNRTIFHKLITPLTEPYIKIRKIYKLSKLTIVFSLTRFTAFKEFSNSVMQIELLGCKQYQMFNCLVNLLTGFRGFNGKNSRLIY